VTAERLHLTIGEVLSLLREEFPDVSISKIRFLESQGLVDPERTPSGYRKFYDQDVERLRWILLQQREHFLPLKVIRGRLTGQEGDVDLTDGDEAPAADGPGGLPSGADPGAGTAEEADRGPVADPAADDNGSRAHGSANPVDMPVTSPVAVPAALPVAVLVAPEPEPAPARSRLGSGGDGPAQPDVYTVSELADAVGCTSQLIRDLQQYGILVAGASVGGTPYFDPDAVGVARIGARFAELGVEPRHLRTWRNAADREASLFEQLVMPLLRQRNPQARRQAADRLDELATLGAELRAGLIAEAVRSIR
jgi:DNA-binding transcriptional MerR regulator